MDWGSCSTPVLSFFKDVVGVEASRLPLVEYKEDAIPFLTTAPEDSPG